MSTILTTAPDNPDGTLHELAPRAIAVAIGRRLDNPPVVKHPSKPDVFIADPGNFWDGPTHVAWEPDSGHFTFDGWAGAEHFPMIGPLR